MERLLHYVWKYKLYSPFDLKTTDGDSVEIIDAGIMNRDAGPDFFNAKIKINETFWIGTVEIHNRASDWKLHGHQADKAYDGVVLHVVGEENARVRRTNGEFIPQMVLCVPDEVKTNAENLLKQKDSIPCGPHIGTVSRLHISSWMEALVAERLQRKTSDLLYIFSQCSNDWNEVFYVSLCRSFGFGINSDAFERLARSLPLRYIQKHRDNPFQVESLIFGQSGILTDIKADEYYNAMRKEYAFLRSKFDLTPLHSSAFKLLRTRPANFPFLKLAQLAAIWSKYPSLFSKILEIETPEDAASMLMLEPSEYWRTHYHFEYASPSKEKRLSRSSANILIINTIVPVMMAYGNWKKEHRFCDKALTLLGQMVPEQNSIVKSFAEVGIRAESASDSQALIQLRREYCEKKKCLYCRIGYQLLKNSHSYPLKNQKE